MTDSLPRRRWRYLRILRLGIAFERGANIYHALNFMFTDFGVLEDPCHARKVYCRELQKYMEVCLSRKGVDEEMVHDDTTSAELALGCGASRETGSQGIFTI